MQVKIGGTDQTRYFHLRTDSDGKSKTGLLYNSAGAIASYVRTRGTRTAITLATLAATDSAHSDGGFIEVDGTNTKGLYRLDIPDAAFASGVDEVIIHIGFTGVFEESLAIELVDERAGNLKDDAITAAKIAADAIGASEFAQAAADKAKADVSALALEASLTAMKGAGWTTETLKAIKDALDAEVGSGALSCTWTQKDSDENPMDNVQVWITTDIAGTNVIAGTLITNASGQVTFMLDAGTYYVWREKAGKNFTNPQTWEVSE